MRWRTSSTAPRRADGIDEVRTGAHLAADHAESETFHLERDVLVAELDGTLVGFSFGYRVIRDDILVAESWGAIVPEHRRRGIGTTLFRATGSAWSRSARRTRGPDPARCGAFALDQEEGLRAQLADEGFVTIRYGFEMRRYITGALPDHPLPDGLEMRPVTPDQHRAIFDADTEAFEDHWGHRPPDGGGLPGLVPRPGGGHVPVVRRLGRGRGGGRRHEHDLHRRRTRPWASGADGWITSRCGGRGAAEASRRRCALPPSGVLRDRGMDEAWLGVDGSNPTGAVRLYEGLGFGVVRRWQAYGRPLDGPAPAGWQRVREQVDPEG